MVFANVVGLVIFLQSRTDRLLGAVVDPLHPDWLGMQRAFAGFTLYGASLVGAGVIASLLVARLFMRRALPSARPLVGARRALPTLALAGGLTALMVLVFIEVLLFQDYGIHLYEFDVLSILADAALRRDLGIQPAEVARVIVAAGTLLLAELLLCAAAARVAGWRDGALARASATAMLITVPGGWLMFHNGEGDISADRSEFEGALPFGKQLLLRASSRPFIAVTPRLGSAGYPVLTPGEIPAIARKANIVLFVADGLRGDMFKPELMPAFTAFAARDDVIRSRRHFSTGHVSEAGIFGLVYGLRGQAFHAFIEQRVPPYPLEVLKRNGYHTLLISSSRLSPYPTDQLMRVFDEVAYPENDDAAIEELKRYVAARRADGRPYLVLGFFYTPHYPFTSAKPRFRKYPMVGPKARTNYMNDVLQADDYFRQTLDVIGDDFASGRTVLLGTADHGEEIRDHGVFGHASATFWNEKIVVPLVLGLPGAPLSAAQRSPTLTSHVDVWPTLFAYLGVTSARGYSDGRSLLEPSDSANQVVVTGRFFPHADRPSVLIDHDTKYWFRVDGLGANGRLCVVATRVTDLADHPLAIDRAALDARMLPAFERLQQTFWRFVTPTDAMESPSRETATRERRIC